MNLAQLQQYAANRNVKAFLDTIAYGEGNSRYDQYYGGGTFNTSGPHPCRKITAGNYTSTAAGRYQFLCTTWAGLVNRFGFTSMSPRNQDLGAIALISDNGGLTKIINGDFAGAVNAVKGIWPSLPGGSQQTRTWQQSTSFFANAGGSTGSLPPANQQAQMSPGQIPTDTTVDDQSDIATVDYFGEQSMISPNMLLIAAAGVVLYLLFRE